MRTNATDFSLLYLCIHAGEHGIRSNYASLTVMVAPNSPKILQGDFIVTTEDREIELECVSEHGKPAAEVCVHGGRGDHFICPNQMRENKSCQLVQFCLRLMLRCRPNEEQHSAFLVQLSSVRPVAIY